MSDRDSWLTEIQSDAVQPTISPERKQIFTFHFCCEQTSLIDGKWRTSFLCEESSTELWDFTVLMYSLSALWEWCSCPCVAVTSAFVCWKKEVSIGKYREVELTNRENKNLPADCRSQWEKRPHPPTQLQNTHTLFFFSDVYVRFVACPWGALKEIVQTPKVG